MLVEIGVKTGWEEVGPIDDWKLKRLKKFWRSLVAFVLSLSLSRGDSPCSVSLLRLLFSGGRGEEEGGGN